MTLGRTSLGLALFAQLVAVAPVRADAAAEARFHDEAARAHYSARRYDAAVREFMIEQRIAPNPNTVLNIAFCFEELERWDEAYTYFAEFLASGEANAERRQRAERSIAEIRPRVALVHVQSEPAGAAIFVDRVELGQHGVTPRLLAVPPGEHRIWVEREGHRQAETTVTLAAGDEERVTLRPEQIVGQLRLTATADAQVRVQAASGETVFEGVTPVDTTLAIGRYDVLATAGEQRWNETVSIEEGAATEVEATLEGPTGELTVVANVPGSLVRLDGREWGFTPQILNVPVGEHALEVIRDGSRAYEGPIEVSETDRAWVSVALSAQPEGPFTTDTLIAGGVALALLAGAGLFTGLTSTANDQYRESQLAGEPYRTQLDETNQFAVTADLLWLTGGMAALTTLVLVFVHSIDTSGPSTATVSRSEP